MYAKPIHIAGKDSEALSGETPINEQMVYKEFFYEWADFSKECRDMYLSTLTYRLMHLVSNDTALSGGHYNLDKKMAQRGKISPPNEISLFSFKAAADLYAAVKESNPEVLFAKLFGDISLDPKIVGDERKSMLDIKDEVERKEAFKKAKTSKLEELRKKFPFQKSYNEVLEYYGISPDEVLIISERILQRDAEMNLLDRMKELGQIVYVEGNVHGQTELRWNGITVGVDQVYEGNISEHSTCPLIQVAGFDFLRATGKRRLIEFKNADEYGCNYKYGPLHLSLNKIGLEPNSPNGDILEVISIIFKYDEASDKLKVSEKYWVKEKTLQLITPPDENCKE